MAEALALTQVRSGRPSHSPGRTLRRRLRRRLFSVTLDAPSTSHASSAWVARDGGAPDRTRTLLKFRGWGVVFGTEELTVTVPTPSRGDVAAAEKPTARFSDTLTLMFRCLRRIRAGTTATFKRLPLLRGPGPTVAVVSLAALVPARPTRGPPRTSNCWCRG